MAGGMDTEKNVPSCALCGGQENVMHLMFECGQYSLPIWKLLKNAMNVMLHRTTEKE
jgi:hypothetical protein